MMNTSLRFSTVLAVASLVAAPLAFAPAAYAQSAIKIAYVNSQKIMQEAPGRAEAEATYDTEMGRAKAQYQHWQDSLKTLADQFDRVAPTLDSTHRELQAQILRDKQTEFEKDAQDLQDQMQQRQADLVRPLMAQISHVLDEIRGQKGYAMIFDVGSQASVVVSADTSLDITDQVIARLKQLGPPPALPASSKPASSGPTAKPAGISRPKQ